MADATNPFGFDYEKFMRDFKVPGFDFEAALETQKRNVEALVAANQQAAAGAQAVAQRQTEIFQSLMGEVSTSAQKLADLTPEQRASTQAELARTAFEQAVANMRELSEMVAKSQAEAIQTINKRVSESLKEVQGQIDKARK